jgi:hypothetical protein
MPVAGRSAVSCFFRAFPCSLLSLPFTGPVPWVEGMLLAVQVCSHGTIGGFRVAIISCEMRAGNDPHGVRRDGGDCQSTLEIIHRPSYLPSSR